MSVEPIQNPHFVTLPALRNAPVQPPLPGCSSRGGKPRGRPRIYANNAAKQKNYRRRLKVKVYHRDKRSDWETPHDLFAQLDAEFHFTLDVCASPDNAKCARYFATAEDGLTQPWEGVCWMNPPYGRGVALWIRKAYESSLGGATVVCLVKSTTDTQWWHTYTPHAEVKYLEGRLTFHGATHPAPFATCLLIFRPPTIPGTDQEPTPDPEPPVPEQDSYATLEALEATLRELIRLPASGHTSRTG